MLEWGCGLLVGIPVGLIVLGVIAKLAWYVVSMGWRLV